MAALQRPLTEWATDMLSDISDTISGPHPTAEAMDQARFNLELVRWSVDAHIRACAYTVIARDLCGLMERRSHAG